MRSCRRAHSDVHMGSRARIFNRDLSENGAENDIVSTGASFVCSWGNGFDLFTRTMKTGGTAKNNASNRTSSGFFVDPKGGENRHGRDLSTQIAGKRGRGLKQFFDMILDHLLLSSRKCIFDHDGQDPSVSRCHGA